MLKDMNLMTSAEMVKEYNDLTGKSITRFASRQDATTRLATARAATKEEENGQNIIEFFTPQGKKLTAELEDKNEFAEFLQTESKNKLEKISKSHKQHIRNKVVVDGNIYRSVAAAFQALGLPLGQHIKFRIHLKEVGSAKFSCAGQDYNFQIIAADEKLHTIIVA